MADLTTTGMEIRTQAEILEEIEDEEIANISSSLDLTTSSPLGQLNRIMARQLRRFEEALQALYLATDPDSAEGTTLDRICALTGTFREPASATRVLVDISGTALASFTAGELVAAIDGRPSITFSNVEAVTLDGAGLATDVIFDADETGPITVTANSLVISGAVPDWSAIDANDAGTTGRDIETDAELRVRRRLEITQIGSASVDGIAADILENVPEVISCFVVENATDATVDSIPPHAFEAVVYGPTTPSAADDQAVADQIFASKAAGIATYGTTTKTVVDDYGNSHTVKFTRPTAVPLDITIDVDVLSADYAGDTALKEAIETAALAAFEPGLDAAGSMIAAWAHDVAGVLRVTDVTIEAGSSFATFAITSRQIATIAVADITVTSTGATP